MDVKEWSHCENIYLLCMIDHTKKDMIVKKVLQNLTGPFGCTKKNSGKWGRICKKILKQCENISASICATAADSLE